MKTTEPRLPLLISHVSSVKNTTEFYREYLVANAIPYYFLQHPFVSAPDRQSRLIYFDGKREVLIRTYSSPRNEILSFLKHAALSFSIVPKYGRKISHVIGFGGFNVLPGVFWKPVFRFRVYFWGVDYSSRRFHQSFLNALYFFFESAGSRYSDIVIHPTHAAEAVRIKTHGLQKSRSLVIPNGISDIEFLPHRSEIRTAFVYIGAITKQHGIVDIVRKYYATGLVRTPLYIYGGGRLAEDIAALIKRNSLQDIVHYFGSVKKADIVAYLKTSHERFVGLAPYSAHATEDHVRFGDSLKIKEYVALGIPYLTSTVVGVPPDILPFGTVYHNEDELQSCLADISTFIPIDYDQARTVLNTYTWTRLCALIPL